MAKQIKAVGYGRTSSESGEEKISVDQQKADYLTACKTNGWLNEGWFEDRDFSGRTYPLGSPVETYDIATTEYLQFKPSQKKHRKGLSLALQCIADKGCSYLYVRDVTRFARPVSGSLLGQFLRSTLQTAKCQLWSGNEGLIDYTKLDTRIVRGLQDELEDHAIKTKTGQSVSSIRAKRDKGEIFRDPSMFGFRSNGHGKLAEVPTELETVRLIYKLFIGGMALHAVSCKLNLDNVPTMQNGKWAANGVRKILKRPVYAGYQIDSKGGLVESPIYKPLAVVTLADYHKAIALLADKSRPKWVSKYIHPLQGLLYCGYCNHVMGIVASRDFSTNDKTYYYRCDWSTSMNKEQAGQCRKTLTRETLGTPATIKQKKGYLSKEGFNTYGTGLVEMLFPFVITGYVSSQKAKASQGGLETHRNDLRARLETIRAKQVQRYSDKENGLLDADTYATLCKALISEKAGIETELQGVENRIKEVSGFELKVSDLEALEGITATEYAQLIRQAVERVLIFDDRFEIVLKTGDTVTLERVPDRNARLCPKPTIIPHADLTDGQGGDQKVTIRYGYKNPTDTLKTVLDNPDCLIYTKGDNNPAKSTRNKRARLARQSKVA